MVYFSIDINFNEKRNDNLQCSSLNVRGETFFSAYDKLRFIMNPFADIKDVYVWYMGETQGNCFTLNYERYSAEQFKKMVSKEFCKE